MYELVKELEGREKQEKQWLDIIFDQAKRDLGNEFEISDYERPKITDLDESLHDEISKELEFAEDSPYINWFLSIAGSTLVDFRKVLPFYVTKDRDCVLTVCFAEINKRLMVSWRYHILEERRI